MSNNSIRYNIGLNRYEDQDGNPVSSEQIRRANYSQPALFLTRSEEEQRTVEQFDDVSGSKLDPPGNGPTDELSYKVINPATGLYERSSTPEPISNYRQCAIDIVEEIVRARKTHGPIASAHEGYAIMLEELDEVKEHVWMKQKLRDQGKMRKELVQLAAMAVAMIVEIADADNRR